MLLCILFVLLHALYNLESIAANDNGEVLGWPVESPRCDEVRNAIWRQRRPDDRRPCERAHQWPPGLFATCGACLSI